MKKRSDETSVGDIGNYYGTLMIKLENYKHYWGIEDWNGITWSEIPESLYVTLLEYEKTRLSNEPDYAESNH